MPTAPYTHQYASSKPTRYVVRHHHLDQDNPTARAQEVIVGYHTDHPDAFSFAVHTASRYQGVIYADYGPEEAYVFVRSYVKRRDEGAPSVEVTER